MGSKKQPLKRLIIGVTLCVVVLGLIAASVLGWLRHTALEKEKNLHRWILMHCTLYVLDPYADEQPAWDIEQNLDEILTALQNYYHDHSSYPPCLFGGARMDDPLIDGGYLEKYPAIPPPFSDHKLAFFNARLIDAWTCAYSTPGDTTDPLCISSFNPLFSDDTGDVQDWLEHQRILTLSGTRRDIQYWSKDLLDYWYEREGVRHLSFETKDVITVQPDLLDYYLKQEKARILDEATGDSTIRSDLLYFGYNRGEWYSAGEDECWLWFYGDPIWLEFSGNLPQTDEELRAFIQTHDLDPVDFNSQLFRATSIKYETTGLDLIDSNTGELEPDGIPDNIFILYKLKGGEIVETVKADGS